MQVCNCLKIFINSLPADTASELRAAATAAASGGTPMGHNNNNNPTTTGTYISNLHQTTTGSGIKSASPTQEVATIGPSGDNRRPAGDLYLPFGRNVPGRSTIQNVPASDTRDRLEQWSRPLVRHPGTAAHMDQKTTLADLYTQNLSPVGHLK